VPRLLDEARDLLKEALGDGDEFSFERSSYLEKARAAFQEKISARRNNQRESSKSRRERHLPDAQRINQRLLDLETRRIERVNADSNGIGGKTQAIRDALPIRAIQDSLIQSLQDESVVVVSGGTGSGKC
jgi:HrpA-like RNA helicase